MIINTTHTHNCPGGCASCGYSGVIEVGQTPREYMLSEFGINAWMEGELIQFSYEGEDYEIDLISHDDTLEQIVSKSKMLEI